MTIEFENRRYESNCVLSSEDLLAQSDLWMEIPPLWVSLHDLARDGWEMKIHSRGGVDCSECFVYNADLKGKDANWWNGRTTVHVRRRNQQNYGIKLTIPGRCYRIEQVYHLLTARNYTSTMNIAMKCLIATNKAAEDAIRDHGWNHLMDARLRMVAEENPDLHEYAIRPSPPPRKTADSMVDELTNYMNRAKMARDSAVVVPLRKVG